MKRATAFLILGLIASATTTAGAQERASLDQMRQAAEQGNADAQLEMGILYEFGYHMPRNTVTALAWYLRAAGSGNALAAKRRDQLKSRMKPEEIDEAQKLAQALAAKKPAPTQPP